MFQLSDRSKQRRTGIDPRLIAISDLAIQITTIDFGHPADAGVRAKERQHQLYLDGKSMADGYHKKSKHQPAADGLGKALDFYAYVDGAASWEIEYLAIVAAAHLQAASQLGIKIKWGGLWTGFKDYPHIQLDED